MKTKVKISLIIILSVLVSVVILTIGAKMQEKHDIEMMNAIHEFIGPYFCNEKNMSFESNYKYNDMGEKQHYVYCSKGDALYSYVYIYGGNRIPYFEFAGSSNGRLY